MRLIDADALRNEWLGAVGEYTANEILNSIDDAPTVPTDGDCVSRKAMLSKVTYFEHDNLLAVCAQDIIDAPAVSREMTAREYAVVRGGMCATKPFCEGCPLEKASAERFGHSGISRCVRFEHDYPDETVAIIQKLAREHPEGGD